MVLTKNENSNKTRTLSSVVLVFHNLIGCRRKCAGFHWTSRPTNFFVFSNQEHVREYDRQINDLSAREYDRQIYALVNLTVLRNVFFVL